MNERKKRSMKIIAALFLFVLPALPADKPQLVVDRGLPQVNLNNTSGDSRANVRWSGDGNGFVGDDFTIGAPGETWVIDAIRTWAVPQITTTSTKHLGDLYQDVRLYFGTAGNALTPVASGLLSEGSDQPDNTAIHITDTTAAGAIPYDDFGKNLRVYEIHFSHLNRVVQGGIRYGFGVFGMGRAIPDNQDGKIYLWFNLASNAQLSANQQDGADGVLLLYDGAGKSEGTFDSNGKQWNKSSDMNVQVFAHRMIQ
jgi:hypothetical protein